MCNEETREAFVRLKEDVTHPPLLALLDFSLPFIIECDALGSAIEVVLMQKGKTIAPFSLALKCRVMALSTYENELYALVMVVQKWRPYLGTPLWSKLTTKVLSIYLSEK